MIQEFRKKTILILTAIFWTTLVGILFTINLSNYQSNRAETTEILEVQENLVTADEVGPVDKDGPDGEVGLDGVEGPDDGVALDEEETLDVGLDTDSEGEDVPPLIKDGQKLSRIYMVTVDAEGVFNTMASAYESEYDDSELIRIAEDILGEGKEEGLLRPFRYRVSKTDSTTWIFFIDNSIWENQQYRMLIYSLMIGLGGMLLLFLTSVVLTGWLVKPIVSAFEKQKQFISDAGHELKTPLTVMKASLDILEGEYGENKYFGYLRDENSRMTSLIHDLLSLSSLEKTKEGLKFERFNLSRSLEGICLPFESLAYEKGLQLEMQLQEGIMIHGNEAQIRQMVEVLLDNAIKHTFPEGKVIVRLEKEKGRPLLQVMNQGEPIPEEERSKIFDRFYRVDKARNREEGRYGLGLAIASSIAQEHKCRIAVDFKDSFTIFSVKFG